MVFQDYELIPTKRVNRSRATKNPFLNRLFLSGGGWNSVYLASVFSYAYGLQLAMFHNMRYNAGAKIVVGAPVFIAGYVAGVYTFGNSSEFWHLLRYSKTYRKEFNQYKADLLYS